MFGLILVYRVQSEFHIFRCIVECSNIEGDCLSFTFSDVRASKILITIGKGWWKEFPRKRGQWKEGSLFWQGIFIFMFPFFNYCTYLMKLLSLVCLVMYIHICYRSLILYFGNNLKFTPFECFSYQRAEDTGPFTVRNRQLKFFVLGGCRMLDVYFT